MKRGTLIGILMLALVASFLAGCMAPVEEVPAEPEVEGPTEEIIEIPEVPEETVIEEVPEEVAEEAPEEVAEEVPEEVAEEAPEEVAEEAPEEEKKTFSVKEGDIVEFNGKKITFFNIQGGNFIEFDVDGEKSKFFESKTSEIVNGLKITYETSNFNVNSQIDVSVEKFTLGENEYLMYERDTTVIGNDTLELDNIKLDLRYNRADTYFSIVGTAGSSKRIVIGTTETVGNIEVTVYETFWRAGNYYAYLKAVPA